MLNNLNNMDICKENNNKKITKFLIAKEAQSGLLQEENA